MIHETQPQQHDQPVVLEVVPVANTQMIEPPRDFRVDVQDIDGAPPHPSSNAAMAARSFSTIFMGGFCAFGHYIIEIKSQQEHYDSLTGGQLLVILNGILFWFGVCCMIGSSIPYLTTGPGRSGCRCRAVSVQKSCYVLTTGVLCIFCYAFFLAAGGEAGRPYEGSCCTNQWDNDKARTLVLYMWLSYSGIALTFILSFAFECYNRTYYSRFLHHLVTERGMIVTGTPSCEQAHPATRDEELRNVLEAIDQWQKMGAPAVVGQPIVVQPPENAGVV